MCKLLCIFLVAVPCGFALKNKESLHAFKYKHAHFVTCNLHFGMIYFLYISQKGKIGGDAP